MSNLRIRSCSTNILMFPTSKQSLRYKNPMYTSILTTQLNIVFIFAHKNQCGKACHGNLLISLVHNITASWLHHIHYWQSSSPYNSQLLNHVHYWQSSSLYNSQLASSRTVLAKQFTIQQLAGFITYTTGKAVHHITDELADFLTYTTGKAVHNITASWLHHIYYWQSSSPYNRRAS